MDEIRPTQSTVHSEAADRRCPPRPCVSLSSSLSAGLLLQIGLLIQTCIHGQFRLADRQSGLTERAA